MRLSFHQKKIRAGPSGSARNFIFHATDRKFLRGQPLEVADAAESLAGANRDRLEIIISYREQPFCQASFSREQPKDKPRGLNGAAYSSARADRVVAGGAERG